MMTRNTRITGLTAAGLLTALGIAPAAAQERAPSLALFPDWHERDGEGRWSLYLADRAAHPDRDDAAWVSFLAEQAEWTVLEWIATTEASSRSGALRALEDGDAPQWLRAADFRMRFADSHASAGARTALERHPDLFAAWAAGFADRLAPETRRLYDSLPRPRGPVPDPGRYLPPYTDDELFEPVASAARAVPFGERLRAAPGEVYHHQVQRAVAALEQVRTRSRAVLEGLLAAARHADLPTAQAACLAFSHLHAEDVPVGALLELAGEAVAEPARREAAFLGATYGEPARIHVLLLSIVTDPAHPHWAAAVSRLGDLGDGFTAMWLDCLDASRQSESQRELLAETRARLPRGEHPVAPSSVRWMLERAAYAELTAAPFRDELTAYTKGVLARLPAAGDDTGAVDAVLAALAGLRDGYDPTAGFEEDLQALMRERVRGDARAILEAR